MVAKKAAAQASLEIAMVAAGTVVKVGAKGGAATLIAAGLAAAFVFVGVAAGYAIYQRFRPDTPPEPPMLPPAA